MGIDITWIKDNSIILYLISDLILNFLTLSTVIIALFAFYSQSRSLIFTRWGILKSILAQLLILQEEIKLRELSENRDETKGTLRGEFERISEEIDSLKKTIMNVENKLKISK